MIKFDKKGKIIKLKGAFLRLKKQNIKRHGAQRMKWGREQVYANISRNKLFIYLRR